MSLFKVTALAVLVAGATCLPNINLDPVGHEWRAPADGELRSPCPMVNSLANHGYLRRNGRDISMEELIAGFQQGINLEPVATQFVGAAALSTSSTGSPNTFHLSDLSKHNFIEHDGSLSRDDFAIGDNTAFNATIWGMTSAGFTDEFITVPMAAAARRQRLVVAKAANPAFSLTASQDFTGWLEVAIFHRVFASGPQNYARRDWVDYFFRNERLPFALGYTRRATPLTAAELSGLAQTVAMS